MSDLTETRDVATALGYVRAAAKVLQPHDLPPVQAEWLRLLDERLTERLTDLATLAPAGEG